MSTLGLVYAVHAADQHFLPNHPECPARVHAIQAALQRMEVFRGCAEGEVRPAAARRHRLPPPPPPPLCTDISLPAPS